MYQDVTSLKPLYLSEEETMALLDLCLMSLADMDEAKEQAVRKLTELARCHVRETAQQGRDVNVPAPSGAIGDEAVGSRPVAETLRIDTDSCDTERLTPITMMARSMGRSHTPRRLMGTALCESRRRIRKIA